MTPTTKINRKLFLKPTTMSSINKEAVNKTKKQQNQEKKTTKNKNMNLVSIMNSIQENLTNNNIIMMQMLNNIVDKCDPKGTANKNQVNKIPEPIDVIVIEKAIDQEITIDEPAAEKIMDNETMFNRLNIIEADNRRMNNEIKELTIKINKYEQERTKTNLNAAVAHRRTVVNELENKEYDENCPVIQTVPPKINQKPINNEEILDQSTNNPNMNAIPTSVWITKETRPELTTSIIEGVKIKAKEIETTKKDNKKARDIITLKEKQSRIENILEAMSRTVSFALKNKQIIDGMVNHLKTNNLIKIPNESMEDTRRRAIKVLINDFVGKK